MAEIPRPPATQRSARLDRVAAPDPRASRSRDAAGKEALYSTAPSAAPTSQVLVHCRACDVEAGVSVLRMVRHLRPPVFWNPISGRIRATCPTCAERSWLHVRKGQQLRALLDRRPNR